MLLKAYAAKVILGNVRAGNADSDINQRLIQDLKWTQRNLFPLAETTQTNHHFAETTRTKLRGRIVISPKLRRRINLICTGVSNLGN